MLLKIKNFYYSKNKLINIFLYRVIQFFYLINVNVKNYEILKCSVLIKIKFYKERKMFDQQ